MDKETKEILEVVLFLKDRMATKDDIANMATKEDVVRLEDKMHDGFLSQHTENRDLRIEIREIHERLNELREEVHGYRGLTKEIDHTLDRVRAIETYIGMASPAVAS